MAGERCVVISNKADADGIVRMKEGQTAGSRTQALPIFHAVMHSDDVSLCSDLPFDPKFVYTTSGSFWPIFTAKGHVYASRAPCLWKIGSGAPLGGVNGLAV